MKTYFKFLCYLLLFNLMSVGAQNNERTEKAKVAFEKMTTSESTWQWMKIKETEKVPKEIFLEKSREIFDLDEKTSFREIRVNLSKNNWKHYRLQQTFNNIPIDGAEFLLHEKNGLIQTANGEVVTGLELKTTPALSEEAALEILLKEIDAEQYAWESEFWENILKDQKEDEEVTHFPKGTLTIVSPDFDISKPDDFVLTYKFDVQTLKPFTHYRYFVDANTGEIVDKVTLMCQNDVTGTCQTHSYGEQEIMTQLIGSNYVLKESGRNIETLNALGIESSAYNPHQDSNNYWADSEDISGCEAHWAAEQTYDYFLSEHSLNGYNGFGQKMLIWVNYGQNLNNAFANFGKIFLGNGDGENWGPFTSLDIVAHEYTHTVNEAVAANLRYRKESGALNESFSDIIGTMVEYKKHPAGFDWLIGEDASLTGEALRSISNPNAYGQPDTYKGINWVPVVGCTSSLDNDFCGVHTNSGVQNYWFYLLSEGGAGTNDNGQDYDVTGLGIDRAMELAYESWTHYLRANSDYADAYQASFEAANSIGFSASEIQQLENAWCAVGVGSCGALDGTITLNNPNGGENFKEGVTYPINWTPTGNIGNAVNLEYSINNGVNWICIVANLSVSTGTYNWTAPDVSTDLALIKITATEDNSITDVSDLPFSINDCEGVVSKFSTILDEFCAGELVTFSNESTGSNLSFEWKINDAIVSGGNNLNYTFSVAGNYEVALRAFTTNGNCADVFTKTIRVYAEANADFTYNTISKTINFIAPYNHFDAIYYWETGDGENYNTSNVGKIYENAGTYTVCLTVNSSCGSDNECKTVQANAWGCTDVIACNYNSGANINDGSCIYGNCNNCLVADSLVLVELYNATDGPNWTYTWDLSQPVNTWYGITTLGCYVTKIELITNGLTGWIPSELGNLQNLQSLNFFHNSLTGSIPPELGNLQNLQSLNFGGVGNNLTGLIPSELGNLQNLQFLLLNNNNLTGSIPSELGNLQNLQDLNLAFSSLTGSIPSELGNLQNLQDLTLHANNLTGSIPSELGNLQNLRKLLLGYNSLTGLIPSVLENLQNLQSLHLYGNSLTGVIPSELGNLQNLQSLFLSDNNLIGSIPSVLGNLQDLQHILLNSNNLTGSIPSELGKLQNLNWILLYNNSLAGCYPSEWCGLTFSNDNDNLYYFNCSGNLGLPDGGSNQGFLDFCNGTSPCTSTTNIYPGDLNFDGVVDYKDILSFGDFYGANGKERILYDQGISWNPYLSYHWGIEQENGNDIKHIDADGNGFIDLDDAEAIESNYGLTHNEASTGPATSNESSVIIDLQPAILPSNSPGGNQLLMDIVLDDTLRNEIGIYGGYFSIYYDEVPLIADIDVNINDSWVGETDSNLKYIVHHDEADNRFDIGFTRIDHSNGIGEGSIGTAIVTIDNWSPGDSIAFVFDVTDISIHNSESFNISRTLNGASTSITIHENDCYAQHNLTPSSELNATYNAQNQIETTGTVTVENVDITEFRGNELILNSDFMVEQGGDLTFYNAPCGTANRSKNSSQSLNDSFGSLTYNLNETELILNLDLKDKGNVSFEILGNLSTNENTKLKKLTTHNFGQKQVGENKLRISKEELPKGKFMACLKVGFDRYYFALHN